MARRDFPLNINRRRLLATGAAVATAAIALRADRVDAALADTVQVPALTPEVPPLNVCAATARRLLDIARRNEIRREAGLPLLSTVKELRRMKEHEDGELRGIEFEQFEAQYIKKKCGTRCSGPGERRKETRTGFHAIGPRAWAIRAMSTRFCVSDLRQQAGSLRRHGYNRYRSRDMGHPLPSLGHVSLCEVIYSPI
jgi:hypothetical protein